MRRAGPTAAVPGHRRHRLRTGQVPRPIRRRSSVRLHRLVAAVRLDGRLLRPAHRRCLRHRAPRPARRSARRRPPPSGRPPGGGARHLGAPAVHWRRPSAALRRVRGGRATPRLVPVLHRPRPRGRITGRRPVTVSCRRRASERRSLLGVELVGRPSVPPSLPRASPSTEAHPKARSRRPLVDLRGDDLARHVVVLDPRRRTTPGHRAPGSRAPREACASAPCRCSTSEWLGKLPLSELERASMLFDIGELHAARLRTREADCRLRERVGRLRRPRAGHTVRVVGNLFANRGPLLYRQQRVGKGGEAFTHRQVPNHASRRQTTRRPTGPPRDDPRVTRFGRLPRGAPISTSSPGREHPAGRSVGRRPAPEQPPTCRSWSTSFPSTAAPPRPARPHRLGAGEVRVRGQRSRHAREAAVRVLVLAPAEPRASTLRIVGRTLRTVSAARRGR